ncbi:hypothetical protein ElyMa_006925600 [Elysia marginata]|uniref:Uncharacterized protein n=1 Tax=Elysia marginata TaxID=1093978 RepID=A0AAV4JGF9_9GAST|nr:hypothetical protein ElyMa_006925600 [Elysia marginata]
MILVHHRATPVCNVAKARTISTTPFMTVLRSTFFGASSRKTPWSPFGRARFVTAQLQVGTQKDLTVSDIINPLFKINVPTAATRVTVSSPDGLSVALSTSYKRSDPHLSNGTGSVSAAVNGGQIIYARFYRGVPTRLTGATATLSFE